MNIYYETSDSYLSHHGVSGQKWGKRNGPPYPLDASDHSASERKAGKRAYSSTTVRSAIARKKNNKVDEGFKNWNENEQKRDKAIELGKKAVESKLAYEKDKKNTKLKAQYKSDTKEYKSALKQNTTYRKGVVKQEVEKAASRKYLSEAKKIGKLLENDPNNKSLQKQYNDLMSKHDVERAKARKATDVAKKRMYKKASMKRTATMTAKAAAIAGTTTVGMIATNAILHKHNVSLNGHSVRISRSDLSKIGELIAKGKNLLGYIY